MQALFKPFSQADPSTTRRFGGTGLGLAISRSYAGMLGGEITVTSEEGKGSEFCIRIPLNASMVEDETESPPESADTVDDKTGQPVNAGDTADQLNLLLIDDDSTVHDILRHQLVRHNFVMTSAYSGHEGLALAKSQPFDVILLDVFMPGMDGWQVLHILKSDAETAPLPVVLYTISSDKQKGFALGASDFLVKPINSQRLISVLQRYRASNHRLKVLLIDDDVHSRNLIGAYLKGPEWELIGAANGREGLACLEHSPDVAVILLDLIMPEMNGFQFLEAFRQRWPARKTPIIVISARDLTADERRLLEQHTKAVFCKGMYDRDTLLTCIQKILNEKQANRTPEVLNL